MDNEINQHGRACLAGSGMVCQEAAESYEPCFLNMWFCCIARGNKRRVLSQKEMCPELGFKQIILSVKVWIQGD